MGLGIIQEVRARAWQVATAAAVCASVGLAGALLIEKHDHKGTAKQLAATLEQRDDLIERNAQLYSNITSLQIAIDARNVAIQQQADRDAAALAEADQKLTAAQVATAKANARVAELMRPLVATDFCSRIVEMDERILKDLGK